MGVFAYCPKCDDPIDGPYTLSDYGLVRAFNDGLKCETCNKRFHDWDDSIREEILDRLVSVRSRVEKLEIEMAELRAVVHGGAA